MGYNFCPFAHQPFKHNLIRYAVSGARDETAFIADLTHELLLLRDADKRSIETSLVIAPYCFGDFSRYNQFLDFADVLLAQYQLVGLIQVASFHPAYQFADLSADDVRNYTNRSPYPMLHLIREESVEQARLSHSHIEAIPDANMARLQKIGLSTMAAHLKNIVHPRHGR